MQIDEKTGFWTLKDGEVAVNPAMITEITSNGTSLEIYLANGPKVTLCGHHRIELAQRFHLVITSDGKASRP